MSTPATIHGIRQQLGASLQPTHAPTLEELDRLMRAVPQDNPYSLPKQGYAALSSISEFKRGPAGRSVYAPEVTYLYRITGVKKLAEHETKWAGRVPKSANNEVLFRYLQVGARSRGGWLALEECARGFLSDRRGFTWWTTHEISLTDPVGSALRLGLPYDRLAKYAVIMRCRRSDVQNPFRVPCAIDAFDNPVFHPSPDDDSVRAGCTINLKPDSGFGPGEPEFCLAETPVEAVELYPVFINESKRPSPAVLTFEPTFWTALESYHQTPIS